MVGEDDVTVKNNLLIHRQEGGSRDRWDYTIRYTLSPLRVAGWRDCSYDALSPSDDATQQDTDYLTMIAREVSRDKRDKDDAGCPEWPPSASTHLTPRPGRNLVGAYNILMPVLGESPQPSKIPVGTVIGDCVPAISTNGTNGEMALTTCRPIPAVFHKR